MAERRILVAAHPAGMQRLEKVLAGYEVMFVETLEEARRVLDGERFCCLVLGVQFDESRMLGLLDHVRSEKHLPTPVVCVIGIKGRLSRTALDAFDKAARALGAREVLDVTGFPDDEQGNRALRAAVGRFVPVSL
jgi:DNA-binding NtrC family response regulator